MKGMTLEQKKIRIQLNHTKCRTQHYTLTVKVETKNRTCFVASKMLTYQLRLSETQREECLRKVRIQQEAEENEKHREIEENIKLLDLREENYKQTEEAREKRKNNKKEMDEENYNNTDVMHKESYNKEMDEENHNSKDVGEEIKEKHIPTFMSLPNITIPPDDSASPPTEGDQSGNRSSGYAIDANNMALQLNAKTTPNTRHVENGDSAEVSLDNSLMVIGGISFLGGLLVMLVLLGIGYMVRRKRRRRGKFNVQQGVDLNFTYGTYSNYYSDYNTVEDTNPYYSSHL